MNGASILVENENKRLNIRLPLLICFAMYNAWKMGIVYFSGQTLSVGGMMPLPVTIAKLTLLLTAGFIISLLVIFFMLRITVWMERLACIAAVVCSSLLFLPLPSEIQAIALYVNFFCCYFMFGYEITIIVALFTRKTAVLHLTAAYGISALCIAALHNEFINVPFSCFRLFVVCACAMQLLFYCKIPSGGFPRHLKKSDKLVMPKRFFAFLLMWVTMSCCVILFGTAVSETVKHGVFALYLSAAAGGFAVFLLWKRFAISPFTLCSVFTAIGALGFIMAICSLFIPALALVSCVFFGMAWVCCWLGPLFAGVLLAKRYPSRFALTAIIGTIYGMILIHSALLDTLRNNTTVQYAVYLIIAVFMVVLYLVLKPYLEYAYRGNPLISGERSAELIEEAKAAAHKGEVSAVILVEEAAIHPDDELTERERQIAQELMTGLSYKEIAKKLYIAYHTVNAHIKSIYKKKGVHNVPELIMKIGKVENENG